MSAEEPSRQPLPLDLQAQIQQVRSTWSSLQPTLSAFPSVVRELADGHPAVVSGDVSAGRRCSVCLQPATGIAMNVLHLYGRRYHAPCANLWCNRVKPLLPTLAPPSS